MLDKTEADTMENNIWVEDEDGNRVYVGRVIITPPRRPSLKKRIYQFLANKIRYGLAGKQWKLSRRIRIKIKVNLSPKMKTLVFATVNNSAREGIEVEYIRNRSV